MGMPETTGRVCSWAAQPRARIVRLGRRQQFRSRQERRWQMVLIRRGSQFALP
jgi:hypothetical protein